MDPNAEQELVVGFVADAERPDGGEQLQRHVGDLARVADVVANRKSGHDHVGIADRLHLVHVLLLDDGIEHGVQVVQKNHNL